MQSDPRCPSLAVPQGSGVMWILACSDPAACMRRSRQSFMQTCNLVIGVQGDFRDDNGRHGEEDESASSGRAGGFRRLAPQRDPIAAGRRRSQRIVAFCFLKDLVNCIISELSNCGSAPGRAGGLPKGTS